VLLKNTYVEPHPTPRVSDALMAARFTSVFCSLAGLTFFTMPVLFFGVSEHVYGTNATLVGGLALVLAFTRMFWPGWSTAASWVNAVLGIWMILSPFVFGYTDWLALTIASIASGAAVIGFSLFSASFTRRLHPGEY
jgi:SPW repeat-containing protein